MTGWAGNYEERIAIMDQAMVYVAADPSQPGAAWAVCVDKPEWSKDTAKSIAKWIRDGANVLRVPKDEGVEMLRKWVRPTKLKQVDLLTPNA